MLGFARFVQRDAKTFSRRQAISAKRQNEKISRNIRPWIWHTLEHYISELDYVCVCMNTKTNSKLTIYFTINFILRKYCDLYMKILLKQSFPNFI